MLRRWSIYNASDGLFTGQQVSYPPSDDLERFVLSSVAQGCAVMEGAFDHLSQRVVAGVVVDYQPPQPNGDHEWIHDDEHGNRVRRWVLSPTVRDRQARIGAILAELAALDARLIRPLSELADHANLEPENIAQARAMVEAINEQKRTLRAELSKLQSSN